MLTREYERRVDSEIKSTERSLEKFITKRDEAMQSLEREKKYNLAEGNSEEANEPSRVRVKNYNAEVKRLEQHIVALTKMKEPYYYYDGQSKPHPIDIYNINEKKTYLKDLAIEFAEVHKEHICKPDKEYNKELTRFHIFRNPTLEEYQAANRRMGLDENLHLEELLNA